MNVINMHFKRINVFPLINPINKSTKHHVSYYGGTVFDRSITITI